MVSPHTLTTVKVVLSQYYLKVSGVRQPCGYTRPRGQLQLVEMIYHELVSSGSSVLQRLSSPWGRGRGGRGGGWLAEGWAWLSFVLPTCHVGQHWAD